MYLQNRSSLWPYEYLVMHMSRALSDLSCYIIIIYKMWGKSESLTTPSWLVCFFPYTLLSMTSWTVAPRVRAVCESGKGRLCGLWSSGSKGRVLRREVI